MALLLLACSSGGGGGSGLTTVASCASCTADQICVTALGGNTGPNCAIISTDGGCPAGMTLDGNYCVASTGTTAWR
jgi:hypothetical protein